MHKATHLEGEPEGGFFAKYSKLLGTGLAASLNAIGEIDLTMCKFENFSSTQILREINFEDPGSSKTAIFAVSKALTLVY